MKHPQKTMTPADGQVWAVPVSKFGFCPLVVARAPAPKADVDFACVYLCVEPFPIPPKPHEIGPIELWPNVWIGLVSTTAMRKERWNYCGVVPNFDPQDWPIPPSKKSVTRANAPRHCEDHDDWQEMWSIETTADEPTMTVIANLPATQEEALQFPIVDVTTAASRLERALTQRLKGLKPGFWDMKLSLQTVSRNAITRWREYAVAVRAKWRPDSVDWLPAGRKTDRALRAGMWLGFPIAGGGFGAAMLVAKPERGQLFFSDAVVMPMRRRWDCWPRLHELIDLSAENGACLAPTSMIVVRDGRWRVIGNHPGFDPEQWVWPIPWSLKDRDRGEILVRVNRSKTLELRIDKATIELDSRAGRVCAGMSSPAILEWRVSSKLSAASPIARDNEFDDGTVTPARLQAWRKINAAIQAALANL